MTLYENRIEGAGFDNRVAGIRTQLDGFSEPYLRTIDAEDDGILERLQMVLDHVLVVTGAAVSQLTPQKWVDDLTSAIASVKSAVDSLEALDEETFTVATVAQLSEAIEQVAKDLMAWPLQATPEDWRDAATAAASTYRRSLSQQLASASAEISTLDGALVNVRQELEAADTSHREALEARSNDLDLQVTAASTAIAAVDTQRESVEAQLARSIERADAAIATQQKQFSDAQEVRTKEASETRDKLIDDTNRALEAQEVNADSLLAAIGDHVDRAANLVSVFAAAGTANAYSKEAKEQGDTADNWRKVAIVLGILAGVAAGTVLLGTSNGDSAWQLLIGKLAVGITFGGIAGYAASQSARHRRREESARHLELNLATFGSLVDELDDDALMTARAELVGTMLRRDDSGKRSDDDTTIGEPQINLVRQIVDMINKRG